MRNMRLRGVACVAAFAYACVSQAAIVLQEGFDNVAGLAGAGWVTTNASTPAGPTSWFQGNVSPFSSQAGAAEAYAAANYFSTSPSGGIVSTWLMTPTLNLTSGMTLSFWTRTDEDIDLLFSDRLNVRLSTAGASTTLVDFSTLLLSVNPALTPGTGYPAEWTQYSVTLSGLPAATSGRIAFEYSVPLVGANQQPVFANYIGLDTVLIESAQVPLPSNVLLFVLGLLSMTFALRSPLVARKLK